MLRKANTGILYCQGMNIKLIAPALVPPTLLRGIKKNTLLQTRRERFKRQDSANEDFINQFLC